MAMPRDVEMQLRETATLDNAIKTAKECLAICQAPTLAAKISSLSLARSPSPKNAPTPSRSPSPRCRNPTTNANNRQSRDRQRNGQYRNSFQGFRQYPGPPHQGNRPRSILRKSANFTMSRGRPFNRPLSRPRSLSRGRNNFPRSAPRCYNCGIVGHVVTNCFKLCRNWTQPQQRYMAPNFTCHSHRRSFQRQPQRPPSPQQVTFQDDHPSHYEQAHASTFDNAPMYDSLNQ